MAVLKEYGFFSLSFQMSGVQDWIIFNERLNKEVLSSQEYTLMAYQPILSVAFHFCFATSSGHRVKFPHSDFEVTVYDNFMYIYIIMYYYGY